MAKSKFFRVATEGATADGRKIDRKDIEDIVATYNRSTLGARINMEHIRGYSPEPPFNSYGDILAVRAEEVDLAVGGKTEKRLALFAQIEPTDGLVEINKKKQKLYSSIEIQPNFANTGKSYLVGMAVTDSPASLGTEILEFASKATVNPFTSRKASPDNLIVAAEEFSLELETEAAPSAVQTEAVSAFTAMREFFTGKKPVEVTPPAVETPPAAPANDLAAFSAKIMQGMELLSASFEASSKVQAEATAKVAADLEAFKSQLDNTPSNTFTQRPQTSGSSGRIRADF
ncbi:GPO family capsid scaffolding protein [Asticcacaulis taihuensis]|uniref:GPO family capsid scaffolding protein n=1 Tax=Asticcacaulis taihuensis TaxID=260084 RepID=UPI0026F2A6C2|nr:GPO family capsid scaffolding protein [Asticcacaulis taihuensis]